MAIRSVSHLNWHNRLISSFFFFFLGRKVSCFKSLQAFRKKSYTELKKLFWLLFAVRMFMAQKQLSVCMLVSWKSRVNGELFNITFVYLNIFTQYYLTVPYYFHVSALNYQHKDQLQHYIFLLKNSRSVTECWRSKTIFFHKNNLSCSSLNDNFVKLWKTSQFP